MKIEPFKSQRLDIRPLLVGDITDSYIKALNEYEVVRFTEAWKTVWTYENVKEYVQSTQGLLGIFLEGKHIGNFHVYAISDDVAGIGIVIFDKAQWGKGYGSETIKAVTDEVFRSTSIKTITAKILKDNSGSIKAVEKAGYRIEGITDNGVMVVINK